MIIQQQFSTRNHPLSILVENYFREFLISKFICSVFPIKLEKNDRFQRPRKSYRFCGLLWLILDLLHDLFQVKCSKERIEISPKYFKNYHFKSLSYAPGAAAPIFLRMIEDSRHLLYSSVRWRQCALFGLYKTTKVG